MTKSQAIVKAQLYLDDTSELSTQEFSDLFDKMYRRVNSDRPWEGTKKEGTGTTSTSVPYISLPADFLFLTANYNHTDSSEYADRPVVFRGTTYNPYPVVSWSDRRQYREGAYAYIDFTNSRLYFTKQPTVAESVEFDYHAQQTALTDNDSPWFPEEYHDVLYHMMVADDFIIQQSDKAKSYRNENEKIAKDYLEQMAYWNSQLVQI
jgi:hypothetical protein